MRYTDYTIQDICDKTGLQESEITNIFLVGSRVYGCYDNSSDYDFIVTTTTNMNSQEFRRGKLNIHVYTVDHFQAKLDEQKMMFIEAFFSPDKMKDSHKFTFKLKKEVFVDELIKNANETYQRFVRLFPENPYMGLKKLHHAIRILDFGQELVRYGSLSLGQYKMLLLNIQACWLAGNDVVGTYTEEFNKLMDIIKEDKC